MIYHMFDTSSAHHLSQDLWLSGLSLPNRGWLNKLAPLWDNNWHNIEELCFLVTTPLWRRLARCRSLIICGRLITVDDAGVGGGAGGRAECRVMMYWCHLSYFFTQAWYITSHPSPAQHRSAIPYSDQAKLDDTRILRYIWLFWMQLCNVIIQHNVTSWHYREHQTFSVRWISSDFVSPNFLQEHTFLLLKKLKCGLY